MGRSVIANSGGMSLVEMMIAGGILAGLVVASMTFLDYTTKSAKRVEQKMERDSRIANMRSVLSQADICMETFSGITIANGSTIDHVKRGSTVFYQTHSANEAVPILSMSLKQVSGPVSEVGTIKRVEGVLEVQFAGVSGATSPGASQIAPKIVDIPMSFRFEGDVLKACSANDTTGLYENAACTMLGGVMVSATDGHLECQVNGVPAKDILTSVQNDLKEQTEETKTELELKISDMSQTVTQLKESIEGLKLSQLEASLDELNRNLCKVDTKLVSKVGGSTDSCATSTTNRALMGGRHTEMDCKNTTLLGMQGVVQEKDDNVFCGFPATSPDSPVCPPGWVAASLNNVLYSITSSVSVTCWNYKIRKGSNCRYDRTSSNGGHDWAAMPREKVRCCSDGLCAVNQCKEKLAPIAMVGCY